MVQKGSSPAGTCTGALRRLWRGRRTAGVALLGLSFSLSGCTTLSEYVHNGFKVGPNYHRPPAAVAQEWIDSKDPRVLSQPADDAHWWTVFNDPLLDSLIHAAYAQNLSVREAGFRVMEARAQLCTSIGDVFPQTQNVFADYDRHGVSVTVANRVATPVRWFNIWDNGFNLSWEIDFWGKFRRAVEEKCDTFDATIEDYDNVLVILFSDVATAYAQIRTAQQTLVYLRQNVELQKKILELAKTRFKLGATSDVSVEQARANLARTESLIPPVEIQLRLANNQLSILLGIPPENLVKKLGEATIPMAPNEVALGLPCDLLRKRPDVRAAERRVAAQCAAIGVAESQLYPAFSLNGTIGYQTTPLKDLYSDQSIFGSFGPSVQWAILNYGRLLNNIRYEEARFQELVATYQNTVLSANREAEDAVVQFLQYQHQVQSLTEAVTASRKSVDLFLIQFEEGKVDLNPLYLMSKDLTDYMVQLAQAQGNVPLSLIKIYRALGGGWQLRLECNADGSPPPAAPAVPEGMAPAAEELPTPKKAMPDAAPKEDK